MFSRLESDNPLLLQHVSWSQQECEGATPLGRTCEVKLCLEIRHLMGSDKFAGMSENLQALAGITRQPRTMYVGMYVQ